jgi:hypothetical protein
MNECDQISARDAARKVRQRAEDRSVTNNLYTLLARTLVDFGDRVTPTGQVTPVARDHGQAVRQEWAAGREQWPGCSSPASPRRFFQFRGVGGGNGRAELGPLAGLERAAGRQDQAPAAEHEPLDSRP